MLSCSARVSLQGEHTNESHGACDTSANSRRRDGGSTSVLSWLRAATGQRRGVHARDGGAIATNARGTGARRSAGLRRRRHDSSGGLNLGRRGGRGGRGGLSRSGLRRRLNRVDGGERRLHIGGKSLVPFGCLASGDGGLNFGGKAGCVCRGLCENRGRERGRQSQESGLLPTRCWKTVSRDARR